MSERNYPGIVFLDAYLRLRATIEGVEYQLSPEFLGQLHLKGVRTFFGITVDEKGFPINDEQEPQPGFLEKWQAGMGQAWLNLD